MTNARECVLCREADTLPDSVIIDRSEHWLVYAHPRFPSEGSVWVQARRHVEGIWTLTEAEAQSLGGVVRRTAKAMRDALGAERVYLVSFGERYEHVHAVLIPRMPEHEPDTRGIARVGPALTENPDGDVAAAAATARRLVRPS